MLEVLSVKIGSYYRNYPSCTEGRKKRKGREGGRERGGGGGREEGRGREGEGGGGREGEGGREREGRREGGKEREREEKVQQHSTPQSIRCTKKDMREHHSLQCNVPLVSQLPSKYMCIHTLCGYPSGSGWPLLSLSRLR